MWELVGYSQGLGELSRAGAVQDTHTTVPVLSLLSCESKQPKLYSTAH